jgi:hypothetical protein
MTHGESHKAHVSVFEKIEDSHLLLLMLWSSLLVAGIFQPDVSMWRRSAAGGGGASETEQTSTG